MTVTLLILMGAAVRGQSLDSFDPNANATVQVLVVQPDGRILIGGDFTTLSPNGGGPVTRNRIARLNLDGTLDTAFNPNANGVVFAIAVQADGKILAGGQFTSVGGLARNFIARLDATTGLADSFDPNANSGVEAIAVQADGKILAGGFFTSIGGQPRNNIARLDATTGLADSFDPNANSGVEAIAVQADGKILVSGFFNDDIGANTIGGQTRNRIARLDATTGLADSFDPNATGVPGGGVLSIALQVDGKILAGGHFTSVGGQTRNNIARLDATTGMPDSFNPNVIGLIFSIAVQVDGKILAGGSFSGTNSIGGQRRNNIARLDATTGLADSFDPNANSGVKSIAVQSDGKILAGGFFTTLAPNGGAPITRNFIARVSEAPVITSPLVATGTMGLPFTYQFTASGATSLAAGNLPAGLTFSTNLNAITGLPTMAGIFQVGLSATNPQGTTPGTLTITVQPAPSGLVIVSSSCATGRTGRDFSFQLQARGGSSATRFAVDNNNLPPGLNLDPSTGFISGTPTSNGSFGVGVSAIDGTATTNGTLQLTFTSDPTVPIITSERTPTLRPGQPFTYPITADASGTFGYIGSDGIVHQGPSPSCDGLPAGLCFDGDHTISGTFIPPFTSGRGSAARPDQTGGIITNVQLFAANPPNGASIIRLFPVLTATGAQNISTRLAVGTGEDVLIGGFIIAENAPGSGGPKKVVIRAVGPSLTQFGVPNALQDSTLELRDGATVLLSSNDNWRDDQGQANQLIDARLQPSDDREAAIVAYLNPGRYTAVVAGKNNSMGNGLCRCMTWALFSLQRPAIRDSQTFPRAELCSAVIA
jgi:uncharacterized delta-60 repeat protein